MIKPEPLNLFKKKIGQKEAYIMWAGSMWLVVSLLIAATLYNEHGLLAGISTLICIACAGGIAWLAVK